MQSQSQWLDMYKKIASISTDYKLAQKWHTSSSRISQIRKGRLKLSFAECLIIAQTLEIDPLEILAALAYPAAKVHEKDLVKDVYFDALVKTIGSRMSIAATANGYRHGWRRNK
ncbi:MULTISPECIES: hypothetical protein [unclassified Neisseria]|uniref:hypothetical protein n=1 Tax=unclassified Neisseria TaxID=2623750 RepID=UPI0010720E4E|nr:MULTISPECIES: hypothetical protein [unclassified Neisseria]MBF0803309.1 hypothetical protein [Neisseria sp. 19428wB4_WF04]TFU43981.1 hypothetical protein E4T99_02905 [Neisseria sp. WF04]